MKASSTACPRCKDRVLPTAPVCRTCVRFSDADLRAVAKRHSAERARYAFFGWLLLVGGPLVAGMWLFSMWELDMEMGHIIRRVAIFFFGGIVPGVMLLEKRKLHHYL